MENRRILIIGLDGVTWRLLEPMMEEGLLPNLKRLREEGVGGVLESTKPPVTATAWVTFQTGVLPGKHGVYEFNQYTPGSYETHFATSRDFVLPTIWELASEQGKKVVVVNVPLTYPPRPVNGCVITGIQTPNLKSTFTFPPELSGEILAHVPGYTIVTPQSFYNLRGLEEFTRMCIKTEQERLKAMKFLLAEKCPDWDIAMFHVQSLDLMQHAVYWMLDQRNEHFDARAYSVAVELYREVDRMLGELFSLAPSGTLKVTLSDHGHQPVYKTINLNTFLYSQGLIALRTGGGARRWAFKIIRRLLHFDRWNLNRLIGRRRRRKLVDRLAQGTIIDWSRTKAYMLNGWVYGNIYINVRGREPLGIVDPGAEYEALREELFALLKDFRDPASGEPVIQIVYRREEIFQGPFIDQAPDLIVVPHEGYEFSSSVFQHSDEVFRANQLRRDHTGSHSLDGICLFAGPMVNRGAILEGARLVDMFPTLLAWMGIPIPSYGDGQVLEGVFRPESLQEMSIMYQNTALPLASEGDREVRVYSEEETEDVEERLRGLGYL